MKYVPYVFLFIACSASSIVGWSQSSRTICFDNEQNETEEKTTEPCLDWKNFIVIDTANYPNNIWKVGKPRKSVFNTARSLPNGLITDPINPYPPFDTSVATLSFHLGNPYNTSNWSLWFYFQEDIDSNARTQIDFSDDNGSTWHIIEHSGTPLPTGVTGLSTGTISGDPWIWWAIMFDAAKLAGHDTLKLRFTFTSGKDTLGRGGWLIDDIFLNSTLETNRVFAEASCSLFPNPVSQVLHIKSNSCSNNITVKNLNWETVMTVQSNSMTTDIDVSRLPIGNYVLTINGAYFGQFTKN
jgi:hypothetical protein